MKSTADRRQTFPPAQFRCVWMLAGVLSYQLCDRDFDCDDCPLDAAMRKQFPSTHVNPRTSPNKPRQAADRLYSRNHCWLKPVGDTIARVGIEPGLAELLVSPKEIVLPQVGSNLVKGKNCMWIVLDGGTFPLPSPENGIVHAINPLLTSQPHECHQHPLTHGWLFELRPSPPDRSAQALLHYRDASRFYGEDLERFKSMVTAELKTHSDVGYTLQDGGRATRDITSLVGPEQYVRILREAFRTVPVDFQA